MLKANSKKVLDIIAGQKTRNASQAYKEVYPAANAITAVTNAHHLMIKPEAQIYLKAHIDRATETVVELMTSSDRDDIRLRSAIDVLDRSHGKAIQQVNQTTNGVTLVIDLTSSLAV